MWRGSIVPAGRIWRRNVLTLGSFAMFTASGWPSAFEGGPFSVQIDCNHIPIQPLSFTTYRRRMMRHGCKVFPRQGRNILTFGKGTPLE